MTVDAGPARPMTRIDGTALWRARTSLESGLHRVAVSAGVDRDAIQLLVRSEHDIPRRGLAVAPGCDVHSVGAWPERGIEGTQLGPNKNGAHP